MLWRSVHSDLLRIVDKMKLTVGDLVGSLLCLVGVVIILGWPRGQVSDVTVNTTIGANLSVELGTPQTVGEESLHETRHGARFRSTDDGPGEVADDCCAEQNAGGLSAVTAVHADALGPAGVPVEESQHVHPAPDPVEYRVVYI